MTTYATVADVQERMTRTLSTDEANVCAKLLEDAALIINAYSSAPAADVAKVVSCRMVIRAIGDGNDAGIPLGATQGSVSALGYSQSWTISAGTTGELYLSKLEKKMLGTGNQIGSYSPTEALVPPPEVVTI